MNKNIQYGRGKLNAFLEIEKYFYHKKRKLKKP
jgi:hypothetical protein